MKSEILDERSLAIVPNYEKLFADRGEITPTDPLEFHFFHLARYWSRLIGFCRHASAGPEDDIGSDLGACVKVGSEYANRLIGPSSPIHERWQEYWRRTQAAFYQRPVTLEDVEAASQAFDECLNELKYDPWR